MLMPADKHKLIKSDVESLRAKRRPMWTIWRELAATYLPYRHPWLLNAQRSEQLSLNPDYITDVGLKAARVQTAGLMNGITSPTRPWVKLETDFGANRMTYAEKRWLFETTAIFHTLLSRSNFYHTMAMEYFDVGLMGMAGMEIFEDQQDVFRVQRYNTGEFYVRYDSFGRLEVYAQEVKKTLRSIVKEYGKENIPSKLHQALSNPASQESKYTVIQYCAREIDGLTGYHSRQPWKKIAWIEGPSEDGELLLITSHVEQPGIFPRWSAELDYGAAPGMDALASMRELIQLLLEKGAGLEKMVRPPMLYDSQLRNEPLSMIPGGRTFVPNLATFQGAKPAYSVALPIGELRADIQEVSESIRETFNNHLFNMISQLDTVRSSREIEERKEEKMVQMAHFLERFENEALDPGVVRMFNLAQRAGMFPDPPRSMANRPIDIQYISILTTAQRALNTIPIERVLGFVAQVASVRPDVLDLINFDEAVLVYGRDLAANPSIFNDDKAVLSVRQSRAQEAQAVAATTTASTLIDGAKTLSDTDVGGGVSALQKLISA